VNYIKFFFTFLLPFLFYSCANVGLPPGGPVDEQPPQVVRYNPADSSVNVIPERITIEMDEFFTVNPREISFSPPVPTTPTYRIRGKNLDISLESTELQPNTTYSFHFGEGIRDLNEGNIRRDFQYVFSTGSQIDTNFITGVILDAFTLQPIKNAVALLYSPGDDSVFTAQLPQYFGKANEQGQFRINFLPERDFMLFGLVDENNNLKYDRGERIGFLDSLITFPADSFYEVRIFRDEPDSFRVTSAVFTRPAQIQLVFNKPVDSLRIEQIFPERQDKKPWDLYRLNELRDTAWYWSIIEPDARVTLLVDADGNKREVNVLPYRQPMSTEPFSFNTNIFAGELQAPYNLLINFPYPVTNVNQDSIVLLRDSVPVPVSFNFTEKSLTFGTISGTFIQENSYTLYFPRGTFINILGNPSDSQVFNFTLTPFKNYSTIELNVSNKTGSQLLVDLVTGDALRITQRIVTQGGAVEFLHVLPGKYRIRITEDLNKNRRWDSGSLKLRRQPEPVRFFADEINVRANWDIRNLEVVVD
jgi:hypothetical protein